MQQRRIAATLASSLCHCAILRWSPRFPHRLRRQAAALAFPSRDRGSHSPLQCARSFISLTKRLIASTVCCRVIHALRGRRPPAHLTLAGEVCSTHRWRKRDSNRWSLSEGKCRKRRTRSRPEGWRKAVRKSTPSYGGTGGSNLSSSGGESATNHTAWTAAEPRRDGGAGGRSPHAGVKNPAVSLFAEALWPNMIAITERVGAGARQWSPSAGRVGREARLFLHALQSASLPRRSSAP
jgi:hypothetical protein